MITDVFFMLMVALLPGLAFSYVLFDKGQILERILFSICLSMSMLTIFFLNLNAFLGVPVSLINVAIVSAMLTIPSVAYFFYKHKKFK